MCNVKPALLLLMIAIPCANAHATAEEPLIDRFSPADCASQPETRWRVVTDRVMGGVSLAQMSQRQIDGICALCLTGRVSLDNNGGFVQLMLDLGAGRGLDARGFRGIRLLALGDGQTYALNLKTPETRLPWQAYRAEFSAPPSWTEHRIPFADFRPHRLPDPLNRGRLDRLGILAVGRAGPVEVCIGEIGLYGPDEPRGPEQAAPRE